jgi:chromo domain-containing protein 1
MATPKQNTTFRDDSDSDSVSITSTAASEPQEEYEVETILAEEEGDNGVDYLIKWEGYPLHR